jgi:ABC-type transporter Mla maintaining outer membrane lipid asymmetry ATPase subunit MlaF
MGADDIVLSLRGVVKDYHALRPLRVERFELRRGETVSLLGLDRAAAEVFVNLVTAATIPDAGEIESFGRPTRAVADPDAWLELLDRFGILSERVALLDDLTVEQNIALPLSLELDELPVDVRRSVSRLAAECGIGAHVFDARAGQVAPSIRARIRLAKSLALVPQVLLAEHPNALLPPDATEEFARLMSGIAASRRLAMVVFTADAAFAAAATGARVVTLAPATGRIAATPRWRRWVTRER